MDSLIQQLQKTIEALETLNEKPATAGEHIDELLDQLFQQKIDLLRVTCNASSPAFQQALQALQQAAIKSSRTVKEPARLGEMTKAVSDAITKLAKLLDSAHPLG